MSVICCSCTVLDVKMYTFSGRLATDYIVLNQFLMNQWRSCYGFSRLLCIFIRLLLIVSVFLSSLYEVCVFDEHVFYAMSIFHTSIEYVCFIESSKWCGDDEHKINFDLSIATSSAQKKNLINYLHSNVFSHEKYILRRENDCIVLAFRFGCFASFQRWCQSCYSYILMW